MMRRDLITILVVSVMFGASAAPGQQPATGERAAGPASSAAWFGVALPHGLGDPHRPILDVSTLTPPAAIVPPGEEANRDLAGAGIRRDLEAIVAISRAD